MLLADQGGRIVASSDGGKTFKRLELAKPMPVTSIATVGGDKLALTGPIGVVVVDAAAR